MKQTLNTFSHKTLAFTILAASLSLPVFANAAEVAAGVNASANVNADGAVSTVAQSVKHAKHHLVKKTKAVKEQATETVASGAEKVKSSAQTAAKTVESGAASVSTGAQAAIAPVTTPSTPTADASANSSTKVGIQTPVGSIGGAVNVGAAIK